MSASSSAVAVQGTLINQAGGTELYAPPELVNPVPLAQSFLQALTSTPVEITLPAGTQWWGLTPPAGNEVAITHQWQTGDTGGQIHPQYGVPCLAVAPGSLTFWLSSASAIEVTIWSG
jgi:hypothetical protein